MDQDEQTGKKIIYYFTKYNNQPVDIKEIAEKLGVSKKIVERKIEQLYQADLVYRTKARFYTFNDICLMRYIKFAYEKDLEDIDEIDLSQQNFFNTLKGKFLEMLVQVTMMKFNHENLEGKFFGKSGQIEVPLFQYVNTKTVQGLRTAQYQIDVFGQELLNRNNVWICECKYTKTKMGIAQLEKLEKAAQALKQEEEDRGLSIPKVQMWIVSTGGFTQEVLDYVKNREDIYYSDYEGINGIFQAFGGNYRIPIFNNG
jgi:predicted transcriptional regulator